MLNFNRKFFSKKVVLFILFAVIPIYIGLHCYYNERVRNKCAYIIVFDENISGLEIGSSVLFNGVKVGYIRSINIDSQNDKVNVVIMIKNCMQMDNKMAQIQSQGIAGHKYINLTKSTQIELIKYRGLMQIGSKKSELSQIIDKAPMIADQTYNLIDKLNKLDINTINDILKNLNNALKKIDKFTSKSMQSVDKLHNILDVINYAMKDSRSEMQDFFLLSIPKLNSSINDLNQILNDASKIMRRFKEKPVKFLLDWYS